MTDNEIYELLEEYNRFLCKYSYCDADVYTEEPKAIDRFLAERTPNPKRK